MRVKKKIKYVMMLYNPKYRLNFFLISRSRIKSTCDRIYLGFL